MFINIWKKFKTMIITSIFFFYLGCGITLSVVRMDCVDSGQTSKSHTGISEITFNHVEYAVLILSGPDNILRRDAIRTTWCNLANNLFIENGEILYGWNYSWNRPHMSNSFVKCFFVIGTQNLNIETLLLLEKENKNSLDLLLLEDLQDKYENLATKMMSTLIWFNDNLKKLKYVIKCDDDSFVRIDLIIRDLDAYAPEMNAPQIEKYVSYKVRLIFIFMKIV